jgi:hypothetical protein
VSAAWVVDANAHLGKTIRFTCVFALRAGKWLLAA